MSDSILMYFNFNFSAMQNLHFSFAIENNKQLTKKFLNYKTSGFMHYLVVKPSLMDILLLDIAGTVVHSYLKKTIFCREVQRAKFDKEKNYPIEL